MESKKLFRYIEADDRDNWDTIMHTNKEQCTMQIETDMKENSRITKFILRN